MVELVDTRDLKSRFFGSPGSIPGPGTILKIGSYRVKNKIFLISNSQFKYIIKTIIMLKIRLSRAWKKDSAFFRVVLTDHTKAAKHGYKEVLGFYNPFTKEFKLKNLDRIKEFLSNGVQFSPRVAKLVKTNNISL